MDSQKFDSLVKTLSSGTPRRRVLKGLAAAAFGGAIAAAGTTSTEAARPRCTGNTTECPIRQGNRIAFITCCRSDETCTRNKGCVQD